MLDNMKIVINIKKRYVIAFLCLFLILGIVLIINAYGGSAPSVVGHTWGEIECPGCITTTDIGDGQVQTVDIGDNQITTQKIADGQVQTADIGDGQVTKAKIGAQAVDQTKIEDGSLITGFGMRTDEAEVFNRGTTPTTVTSGMVYIPSNAQKVQLTARITTDASGRVAYVRLKVGSLTSVGVSRTSTTYGWVTDSPLDVSSLSGWQLFEVQAWNNVLLDTHVQGFSIVWMN